MVTRGPGTFLGSCMPRILFIPRAFLIATASSDAISLFSSYFVHVKVAFILQEAETKVESEAQRY
jgi:hypothetical protein